MLDFHEDLKGVRNELTAIVEGYFHEYAEGLRRYAFTLLRDEDESKDAVQAVFLKIWEKKEELDSKQSVKSYLYTAVYRHCLNIKRHEKVKQRHIASGNEPVMEVEDRMVRTEDSRQIMASLENLPPRCKEVFMKSRLEEKKYAEIAIEMGISVKTVEVQMGKALKMLRKHFFGQQPGY
jgi:RNA polymerase sigma-19 factor, ECF subfamily